MPPVREWVVDTGILVTGSDAYNDLCIKALRLLDSILTSGYLALDHEDGIRDEYGPYVRPGTHAAMWWSQMARLGRFVFYSGKLPRRVSEQLTRLKFDTDDWKFLGVASRTQSHFLVAEESDFWKDDVDLYIKNDMKIVLMKIREAVAAV